VLSVVRVGALEEALAIGKNCSLGNGASIFTSSGYAAREFKQHFNAGMIGINIGVPAPMAWFPFTGWNDSFFGDLHIQGRESIQFYTQGQDDDDEMVREASPLRRTIRFGSRSKILIRSHHGGHGVHGGAPEGFSAALKKPIGID